MPPDSALPALEPLSLPALINESGRRILWIVGIYRAVCAALLLSTGLFLDLRSAGIMAPNAFVTAAGLYFLFSMAAFWWVQRDSFDHALAPLLLSLLLGDIFFIALLTYASGGAGTPLSISMPVQRRGRSPTPVAQRAR